MAIQVRRGNEADFDKSKMLAGEFAVSTDEKKAYIAFGPGDTKQLATKEDYDEMMNDCETAIESANQAVEDFRQLEIDEMAINDTAVSTTSGWSSDKISKYDTKDNVVTFTEAPTRTNINTGEKHSVIFGKIKKFFSDLKTVAFSGKYTDLTDTPSFSTVATSGSYNDLSSNPIVNCNEFPTASADTLGKIYRCGTDIQITLRNGSEGSYTYMWTSFFTANKLVNGFATTVEGYGLDARAGKTLKDSVDELNNNLATETEKVFAPTDFTATVSDVDTCYAYKYGHKTDLRLTFYAGAVITANTTILTIPSGFRPPRNVKAMFSYGGGTVNCVTVYTDGSVKADADIPSGVWSFIYLSY